MKRGGWALWHREVILDQDGVTPYLTRRRIFMTPLVSLYFHRIHREDWDRALHDHPATFLSLILSGGYLEEWAHTPRKSRTFADVRFTKARLPGRLNYISKRKCHRISMVCTGTKTLVLLGPRRGGEDAWGFWVKGATKHVPWRQYLIEQGHPQAGER